MRDGEGPVTAAAGPASTPLVLVVEDETMIRTLLVDELESAGLCVIEAENADIAMECLLARPDIGPAVRAFAQQLLGG